MTDVTNAAAPEAAVSDEDLWNEIAKAEGAATAPDAGDQTTQPDEPSEEPTPADTDAAEEAAEDGDGAPKEAVLDKDAEIERLRAENEQVRHKLNSSRGRISALTRKINGYDAARRQVEAASAETPDTTRIKQEFPELAALNERQKQATQAAISVDEQAAREELHAILAKEAAEFQAAVPDGFAVLAANKDRFSEYLGRDDTPIWVLRAWQENENAISNAESATRLLKDFKRFIGAESPASTPETKPQPPALDPKRQRQLQATKGPANGPARPHASGIPADGDPEEIWKMFAERDRQRG